MQSTGGRIPVNRPEILWLDDAPVVEARIGGKAASLGALTRAGLPVPRGFCLAVETSERHLRAAGLEPAVERLMRTLAAAGDWRREAIALRARLAGAELSPDLVASLRLASEELYGGARVSLAVRSSAVGENQPGASFAGQFATFLGVLDFPSLVAAVHACWASRFSDAVLRYALGRGVDPRRTSLAVVVQVAVHARAAGVALSADPSTLAGDTVVITGAWGLGRAVSQGEIIPDVWRLERDGLAVRERHIGNKPLAAGLARQGGEVWRPQSPGRANAPCLSGGSLARIGALALEVERLFGSAQEVEWVISPDRQVWLVQARPASPSSANRRVGLAARWSTRQAVIEGQPTSSGQAVGPARLVRRPADFAHVRPGDVLVATSLPPTTAAVLPLVAGLIVEAGGSTAHSATLARERGIPAIMGAVGATRLIPEGALVLVDGTLGRAWLPPLEGAYASPIQAG